MPYKYDPVLKILVIDEDSNKELDRKKKKLELEYDNLKKISNDLKKARENQIKLYKKLAKQIKKDTKEKTGKEPNEYQIQMEMNKNPEYKALKKESEKFIGKHSKATSKFKELYNDYRKSGGEKVLEWYQASTEWDDAD